MKNLTVPLGGSFAHFKGNVLTIDFKKLGDVFNDYKGFHAEIDGAVEGMKDMTRRNAEIPAEIGALTNRVFQLESMVDRLNNQLRTIEETPPKKKRWWHRAT